MTLTALLILITPFALAFYEKKTWEKTLKELLIRPLPKIKPTVVSALKIFAVFFIVLIALNLLFLKLGLNEADKVREVVSKQGFLALVFAVTLAPIGEELLFRGYLQKRLGIILSSLVFAAFHVAYGSYTEVIAAFSFSIIAGLELRKTKNVYACILSHALFNGLALLAFLSA